MRLTTDPQGLREFAVEREGPRSASLDAPEA